MILSSYVLLILSYFILLFHYFFNSYFHTLVKELTDKGFHFSWHFQGPYIRPYIHFSLANIVKSVN